MNRSILTIVGVAAFSLTLGGAVVSPALAVEPTWINPAIPDFGAVVSLPDAGMQPSREIDYKVVFNITGAGGNDNMNPSLERVARAVNVFVSAGVPLSHLHFVAVIHGPATPVVLDSAHYKDKFSLENPNIKLIRELKSAGVKVVVCGQALAHNKFPHEWVNPEVEITLAAISDLIILEQQGYVLLPL